MAAIVLSTGASLWVEREGTGPPVVLIHGGFVSLRIWDPQMPTLARNFTVVRYDVRGFGRSPLVPGKYSDETDLQALLDALGLSAVHFVGLSMGGRIALDFALRYPESVKSLVIVPGGISGSEAPEWMDLGWRQFLDAAAAGNLIEARDIILEFPPMRSLSQRPALRQTVAEIIDEHRWLDSEEGVEYEALEPPAIQRLGNVRVPTLVLSGALDDEAFLKLGDDIAHGIPGGERLVIPGASHMVNMEAPEEFNEAVVAFISRVERMDA